MPSTASSLGFNGMVSTESTDFAGDPNISNHFRIVATTATTLNLDLGEMAEIVGPVYVPDDRLEVHGDFRGIFDGRNTTASWLYDISKNSQDLIESTTKANFVAHLRACLSLGKGTQRDHVNKGADFVDELDISHASSFADELRVNILSQIFGKIASVFVEADVEDHLQDKMYATNLPVIFDTVQCGEIYEILKRSGSLGIKRKKNDDDTWSDFEQLLNLDEGDVIFESGYTYYQYIKGWSNKDFMGIKVIFKQDTSVLDQQTATLCLFQDSSRIIPLTDPEADPQADPAQIEVRFVKVIDGVTPNIDTGYESSDPIPDDVPPSLI